MSGTFSHIPVMASEVLEGLSVKENGLYIDCTVGGGGHSIEIARRLNKGKLIAIDKDCDALDAAKERLKGYNVEFVHDDFKNVLKTLPQADGILMDLGVSSYQIDTPERGFSYKYDSLLDMRMDTSASMTAHEVINGYSEERLAKIMFEYGEERFSRKIASRIVEYRRTSPIERTLELVSIIEKSIPVKYRYSGGHPAKRVFQAIRIEVNKELQGLYEAVISGARGLVKGGRICVISFHSLEDRIIKNAFKYLESDCICDKSSPICTCDKVSEVRLITKKPLTASEEELKSNKRAESAKLRIAEKR